MEKFPVLIIGAGPAGLSAAIYTARAGKKTLILGDIPLLASKNYEIENYFGFAERIGGKTLFEQGLAQAQHFGAVLKNQRVFTIHYSETNTFIVNTDKTSYEAETLILATGVSHVKPKISNLAEYEGKGVSYCVSCDGFFYREKKVMVLGEGNYAASQALELLNYTPFVSLCSQGKALSISDTFRQDLKKNNITIIESKIDTLAGTDAGLESVQFSDGSIMETFGLFIAMGDASSADFAKTLGIQQEGSYLVVDNTQSTAIPGIYAAGDCTGGFLQISVSVGEGAKAGKSALDHLRSDSAK